MLLEISTTSGIFLVLGIALLMVYVPTTITMTFIFSSYKEYEKTYNELPNLKYVKNIDQVYDSEGRGFVWFTRTQEFRLLGSDRKHLHNDIIVKLFNPYSEYWRKKYIKWFKENINVETLDKFDPFIHKH
jgi:hypothetical protein